MNRFIGFLMLLLALVAPQAFAAEPAKTEAQVKLELLHTLEKDGYLSQKLATEAKMKYIDATQLAAPVKASSTKATLSEPGLWERYGTWANFLKVVAIGFILIAAGGTIKNIIKGMWHLLVQVPVEVYQIPMLAASIYATIAPQAIWASEALYVALAASFINIMLAGWFFATHERLTLSLLKMFNLGIPVGSVLNFWGMLYFGALALHYQSQVFGFFSTVCLSGVLTFGLYYTWGTLFLHFKENALPAVVFGHLAVLVGYGILHATNHLPAGAEYFAGGQQYYCAVALGVGLLVGASPWNSKSRAMYVMLFAVVLLAASAGYTMYDLTGMGSVLFCFGILFVLEWVMYVGFQGGLIAGCAVGGATLYGVAMLMQHFGKYIVLSMA
jgi:hypothetical protein